MLSNKKPKVADLEEHLVRCSAAYQKFLQILPKKYFQGDIFHCQVNGGVYELKILERNPYTDIVILRQHWEPSLSWLTNLVVQLRLCHDMNVAEVITYQFGENKEQLLLRSISSELKDIDEKQQIQQVLFEWLLACKPFTVKKCKI